MFARILAFEVKPEKKEEFVQVLKDRILPILHQQVGFLELLPFFAERTTKEKVCFISLWTSRLDAERYKKESYAQVIEVLKPFLASTVEVNHFNLETRLCDRFVDALAV
jgi:quinol monooxygenase YgiN